MATIVKLSDVIVQGATYRLDLDRVTYPYDVVEDAAGNLVRHDGTPAFDGDRVAENYVGCSARMQIRETLDSPGVIAELTTENGGSGLAGGSTSAGEAGYAAGLNVNGAASVTWVRQGDA